MATIVGYFMLNPVYSYILDTYDYLASFNKVDAMYPLQFN